MDADVELYIKSRFKKIKLLRKTEKGEVWLASTETGENVILKRINFAGLPYLKLKENFNPFWAKILYFAEEENETLVVEEFISGEVLADRIERKKYFTENEVRKILLQICDGLEILHSLGIIHRDIKPSNLILQPGGIVRLTDFDAARIVKENQSEDTIFLGTKGYAPPEQYGSEQTDARSDIYALGITAKKLLGENYTGYLKKILEKCTAFDPAARYQSAKELKRAIIYSRYSGKIKILATAGIFCGIAFSGYNLLPVPNESEITKPETLPENKKVVVDSKKPEPEKNNSVPEVKEKKFSPFSADDLKIPENKVEPKISKKIPVSSPDTKKFVAATLYLDEKIFNQAPNEFLKISPEDLNNLRVRLHLENKSGALLRNSKIKILFQSNFGKKFEEIREIKPVNSGESADIFIRTNKFYELAIDAHLAWLQIYLLGNEDLFNEKYWCVNFSFGE